MRFKEISIEATTDNNYSSSQQIALENIASKLNSVGKFFDKVAEFENLILKNIYNEYIHLVKIRENRTEIEKIGGVDLYISEYFLKSVHSIENKIKLSIEEWNSNNEEFNTESIKNKIEIIKEVKKKIGNDCKEKMLASPICAILDLFDNFKIHKIICMESTLDKIELLISFKSELIRITNSDDIVKTFKEKQISIDDI